MQKPYIELSMQSNYRRNRKRRMLNFDCTETETSPSKACCRYPMTLNFTGMGWDWILAPKVVDVNYCSGECEIKYLINPYIHFVQQTTGRPKHFVGACCVPKVYNPLKMIYYSEQDRIQFGTVKGIVVNSCGCT